MTKSDRANFGSKLGVILASAGSAVGLGNIWRFPFETGNHGGAAFILVYLVCVLILGIPIMIARSDARNAVQCLCDVHLETRVRRCRPKAGQVR